MKTAAGFSSPSGAPGLDANAEDFSSYPGDPCSVRLSPSRFPAKVGSGMKILHLADAQLGKPMASIEDPETRTLVQRARLDALENAACAARDEDVAAVLIAGDLFDSPRATRKVVSAACAAIGKMKCPVYVIPGNHDHGGPGGIWEQPFFQREQAQLAPNLHLCLTPRPVEADGFVLFPCPLLRRTETADTTAWLREPAVLEKAAGRARIVLAHGSVVDFSSDSRDLEDDPGAGNHLALERLPREEVDYIALGDWHGVRQVGPKAWYAGAHEYDRFPKGDDYRAGRVLLVDVERGRIPEVELKPVGVLDWRRAGFSFREDADLEPLAAFIDGCARTDVLHLTLEGNLGFAALGGLRELLESLRARILYLRLEDRTRLTPSAEEIRSLTEDDDNPVIAHVAERLIREGENDSDRADVARIALQTLYGWKTHRG